MKNTSGKKEPEQLSLTESCHVLVHDLVYILAFVTVFFVLVVRVVMVDGYSMYPTLVNGDYVALVSNTLYRGSSIHNGDVVVAIAPDFSSEPIVKRVIATAGQTIDIDFEQGIVYVDGVALQEDYINELTTYSWGERGVKLPLTVEEGHIFAMGDNRNASSDSRLGTIGQIDTRYVLGKVVFIMFPGLDKFSQTRSFSRIGGGF